MVFAVIYRWKVKPGQEKAFEQGWLEGTKKIYEQYGSLGSSLHRGENGIYVGYARRPSKEQWQKMWDERSANPLGTLIGEPECLELKADYLQKEPSKRK